MDNYQKPKRHMHSCQINKWAMFNTQAYYIVVSSTLSRAFSLIQGRRCGCLFSLSNSALFVTSFSLNSTIRMSILHASCHFLISPGISASNTLLSTFSSSLLIIICLYHFYIFSVIFLDASITLVARSSDVFVSDSFFVTPHVHLGIDHHLIHF